MDEPEIVINTIMPKEDYRKFLYISTFKKNKSIFPFLCLISLIWSILISYENGNFIMPQLIISWILLFLLAIIVLIFKIERKYSRRIKTDKTGTFDSVSTLKFYDDKIVMENKSLKSTGELKYDQFFTVMESKDYFIFYFTVNQASLVRKKDIDDLNAFREFIVEKFINKYRTI